VGQGIPVILIHGLFLDHIKGSTLVEIEQCGHSSSIEQPEKVTELLAQLLQTIEN
jgi:pimeloyl-ACP methyl ester carboxylesterase